MRIHVETDTPSLAEPTIGAVYQVRGGRGAKRGHVMILFAIAEAETSFDGDKALMLVVDREGNPRGVTSYGMHYIRDLCPIAQVDGIDAIDLTMRSI